jgi:hypothetical protein
LFLLLQKEREQELKLGFVTVSKNIGSNQGYFFLPKVEKETFNGRLRRYLGFQ